VPDPVPRHALRDGEALHYEDSGGDGGAPVVLLHGILDSADVWARVAARLRAHGQRVVLVDAPAHGRSTPWRPGHPWAIEDEARDVASLLRALAPEGAHLVGHSRGATVASWVAAEAPELARTLAIVASPPQAGEAFRAHFRQRIERAQDERSRDALRYLSTLSDDEFPQHALRRYESPALVVEAEDDPLYSPVGTMFWRMFLPYADFERVPGGHRFFAESDEQAEWLARRLLAHVARPQVPS
jgi:pimeloyl-ACP methyl ester carboxylesterase